MAWGAFEDNTPFAFQRKKPRDPMIVALESGRRRISLRSKPYRPMKYSQVLELKQRGCRPLSPIALEWLRIISYREEPLLVRECQTYLVMDHPPYWTSQGMGIIFDPDEKEPHQYRGKFIIAEVEKIDLTTGMTFPNYDKAIVLGISDLEKMLENEFIGFQIDKKTGLSIPTYGRKSKSFREILKQYPCDNYDTLSRIKSALLKPFAPIVGGFKNKEGIYPGNFYTADPRIKYPVWVHNISSAYTP